MPLQWRHNGCNSVSNHQPYDCLVNRLFRRWSKKISKPRVTGLCARNSPGTGEFPAQMASYAENVSIWWRHHAWFWLQSYTYYRPSFYGYHEFRITFMNRITLYEIDDEFSANIRAYHVLTCLFPVRVGDETPTHNTLSIFIRKHEIYTTVNHILINPFCPMRMMLVVYLMCHKKYFMQFQG